MDISQSGILARFDQPIGIWVTGEISMVIGEYIVNIEARTARIEGDDVGLSFFIEGDNDRLAVKLMNDYATKTKPQAAPVESLAPGASPGPTTKSQHGHAQ